MPAMAVVAPPQPPPPPFRTPPAGAAAAAAQPTPRWTWAVAATSSPAKTAAAQSPHLKLHGYRRGSCNCGPIYH